MSLLLTKVQDLREKSPDLSKNTLRLSRYGAYDVFAIGNNEPNSVVSPDLYERAKTAIGRNVTTPVYDSRDVTIGSTRSVTIADDSNDSQMFTFNFTTYAWGFTHVPSEFLNNELGAQADFNRKYLTYLYKLAALVDQQCLTALSVNKNQPFSETLSYTEVADRIVASNAQREQIIGSLSAIMNSLDYYGDYRLIGNAGLQDLVNQMYEKSVFNEVNRTLQFLDKSFHYTNRLVNEVGEAAGGYMVNQGSLGLLFRHEREAVLGTTLADGTSWKMDNLPILDMPVSTYFYYGAADATSFGTHMADASRVAKEHYGFSIEVATVVAYNDDIATNANPIIGFGITTA